MARNKELEETLDRKRKAGFSIRCTFEQELPHNNSYMCKYLVLAPNGNFIGGLITIEFCDGTSFEVYGDTNLDEVFDL